MAAFLAEFSLCGLVPRPGGGPVGVLGVEPGGEEADRLLVTDCGRTVTLYKVSDQKPLGSWTVKQGQTITCPAVCNFATGEYVTVHDDKVLRIWKDDDVNLEKVFKATLSADVHRLHSHHNTEPLVLFKGGATRFLDALLAAPQQEIEDTISEGEVIRWSEMLVEGEQTVLLFITERRGDCFVYVQNLKLNSLLTYELQPEKDASLPLSFTASIRNKSIRLLTLYFKGLVYETEVPLQRHEPVEQQLLPKSLLLNLPAPKNTAVAILDKTHVAVLGALPNQQEDKKECLCIWNIKFQTLQVSKELLQGTSGQLWCYGGKLYVPHGKMLTVIPYQCGTSSLVAALGKQQDIPASDIKTVTSVINWNIFLQDASEQSSSQEASAVKEDLNRSLRSKKNSVPKADHETITAERLLTNMKNCKPGHIEEELKQYLSNAQMPDYHITIGKMASAVVSRCKTEPHFYPWSVLIQLMQTNGLSHSSCPDLIPLVIEKTDMHLLQLCLQQFRDVPEAVTCACLKAVLSISDASLERVPVDLDSVIAYIDVASDEKVEPPKEIVQNGFSPALLEEDSCDIQLMQKPGPIDANPLCPVSMKKAALLNAVLLTAYSETFLLPHLKDLSAQQVILFLQYLQYLYVKCSENASTNLPGMNVPNINQIMDWMSLLLDAHFTVVVMLPEAKGLLANLHKFVRSQVKLYSELNKIEGSLLELQRIKRQKEGRGLYSIEILELV